MKRRDFIRTAGVTVAGGLFVPEWLRAADREGLRARVREGAPLALRPDDTHLVILHTNDTHSRIDPFPLDGGRFEGLGGAARRATLIKRVREESPNVLLLDSGDIFQGTPYFNFFKGEIEFQTMSAMGYDVATLGNHDFDNGVEGIVEMMPHADFQFVSANYDVSASPLVPHVRPWTIREVGGVRVGIFGLGIAFEGLVLEQLHRGVRHTDPYGAARRCVSELRAQGCSLVICLSHLGYRYRSNDPCDTLLAQEVDGIDLILGGHSHTFQDQPDVYTRADGGQTLVNQVGWAGMRLGRVDVAMGEGPVAGLASRSTSVQPKAWSWAEYSVDSALD
jgi:5'-nucleotidase